MRRVIQRKRQVKGRIKRIADAVVVGIGGHTHVVQRIRRATRHFVGIRPTVVVVIKVFHQRWSASGSHAGHQSVGHVVTIGVHRASRIERECVRTARASTVGGCLWSVADTVTVTVRVDWAGAGG